MSVKSDLVFTRSYLVLSKSHLNDQNLPTLFLPLTHHVSEGGQGVIEQHARTGPAHHLSHACPLMRGIAMVRATAAGGFVHSPAAMGQATAGIVQQFRTGRTKRLVAFITPAIEPNHQLHHPLFLVYAV